MTSNLSVEFFAKQFDRQIAEQEYRLNPFEQWTLPHLAGRVLELGCGLGNLSIEAARAGHEVTAIDACPDAVKDLGRRAQAEGLPIRVLEADLTEWRATETWDTVVAIGLLMFFACEDSRNVLQEIKRAVAPGGIAAVNVLIEGTTYMEMFDPQGYCLFPAGELEATFADWRILLASVDDFLAPGEKIKRFATVIAQRA
ncbi:class I SAM-dependent methyltransferase [Betaproteobacteria bacterium PRO7]|jgi:tellurite methyltransferase|nr:class I SAM-dependent methyltransferase [Betaproteobacteria bacterium PRO7]GIL05066.1 MAG: hypothetical protein BroJett031_15860 [Betaproteobacteria bacterium]